MKKLMKKYFLSIAVMAVVGNAYAAPIMSITGKKSGEQKAELIYSTAPDAKNYIPVGKLKASSDCTATLISGAGTPGNSYHAIILTAGHCVKLSGSNEVIVDSPPYGNWTYTPNYFIDKQEEQIPIRIRRILFSTIKSVDLAVLELEATYGELAGQGVYPLKLDVVSTTPGTSIELYHVPVIGVPEGEQYLRRSRCEANLTTPLYEDRTPWFWKVAVANNCQGIAGGTSGSPVLLKETTQIIGILNTTVVAGLNGCGVGRPCELLFPNGTAREGASYFMPIASIAQALTDDGRLLLDRLDDGKGVQLDRQGYWATKSQVTNGDGSVVPATWNVLVPDDFEYVRFKAGLASTTDCISAQGYSRAISVADQPLRNIMLPSGDAVYAMCVVGKRGGTDEWQSFEHASQILHQIDNAPPLEQAGISLYSEDEEGWSVYAATKPNEISATLIKYGPRNATDCNDKDGYFYPKNFWEYLSKDGAPWRFCVIGQDAAGNNGPVNFRDFMND